MVARKEHDWFVYKRMRMGELYFGLRATAMNKMRVLCELSCVCL